MPSKRHPIETLRRQAISQLKNARNQAVIQAWMELQDDELCQTVPSLSQEQRLALIQVKLKEMGVDLPENLTKSISPSSSPNSSAVNPLSTNLSSVERPSESTESVPFTSSTSTQFPQNSRTRAY
ncbi:hypothetical protein [Laspinema olomoucense]|uniref:Uncharacterized protein n=1 Tax=Laspinema olomoucense D3b TaxID=2953688 RepID=A0ABT2NEF3_9CYAN|nr:hypothetical protein [Laspinema sp. D3b]MCT7981084.1 hypothetical protein [Laspinema sp. D3b]